MSLFTRCTGQFQDDSGIKRIALHTIRSHLTMISIGYVAPADAAIDMELDESETADFMAIVTKIAMSENDKSEISERVFAYMILASGKRVVGGKDFADESGFWQMITDVTGVA